jgi:serine/threonine protein kinase/Tfp pilus assembly protein PilF
MISRDRVNRFEQEARAISALNHPNIVTIHEIGRLNDVNFIVTEFIDGQTLREIISERRIDVLEALDLSVQIANALSAAHAAGIIHRDIKPENIMVRGDGYVKVLDFGLAKLMERQAGQSVTEAPTKIFAQTQPGLVMGSTSYMSPEQARGTDVDGKTDIWSLGVVLYEMLTGCAPFEGETPTDVIAAILERQPPALVTLAPSTSPKLQAIVTRTLKKHRDERYQTIGHLLSELRELKQALDARAHLERRAGSTESVATREAIQKTTTQLAAHTKSSAEYIVGELKHHKAAAAAAAALIFVIAIGLIVGYSYFSPRNRSAAGAEAIDSIAVLPFVNVDNDPNKEYLAEGISDSLITNLTQLDSLRVMSLSSVLRYKGKQTDAQTVGRELKVGAVLMGRLIQRGDELSISTELIDARDNRRLWGQQYNRNVSNILLIENEIGQEVAQKIRPGLTGQEQKQLAKPNTENTEAYHLYSLGNYYLRNIQSPERVHKAVEYFNRAIEADPKYALAYHGLFKIYFGLGGEGQMPPKELRPKVEWAALKAVELDDSLAAAHAALGFVKKMNWDWAGAEKEYQRAIELDPNNFNGYFGYYILLINIGRADEAIPLAKRAMELDELPRNHLAFVNLYKREFDAAIDLLKKESNPKRGILQLGEAYLGKGMNDEAVAQFENLVNPDEPTTWRGYPMLAYAYAAAGQREKALKILDEQKKLAKQRYVSPFNFAIIYTGLGDKDRAFQSLEKCIEERVIVLYHFPHRPIFDPLRSDPRYEKLLRKMNLPA